MISPILDFLRRGSDDPPRLIAHRGARRRAPENTLPAFEMALAEGADAIEMDARLTRDGVAVLLHDPVVKTKDGRTLWVSALRLEEVRSLDAGVWFDAAFAGTPVPTLQEVFQWARGRCALDVDLKGNGVLGRRLAQEVVRLAREEDVLDQLFCVSFNPWVLRHLRGMDRGLSGGLLYLRALPGHPLLRFWRGVARPALMMPEKGIATGAHIAWVHGLEQPAVAWVVNEPAQATALAANGVDALVTDDVPVLRAALEGRHSGLVD